MIWFLIVPMALMGAFAVAGFAGGVYEILRYDDRDRGLLVFVLALLACMLVGISFATF